MYSAPPDRRHAHYGTARGPAAGLGGSGGSRASSKRAHAGGSPGRRAPQTSRQPEEHRITELASGLTPNYPNPPMPHNGCVIGSPLSSYGVNAQSRAFVDADETCRGT
jgi:hypothetical protein